MTESQVIAVLSKLSAEIPEYTLDDVVAELKAGGVSWRISYDHDTILYDTIWEHPRVVEHNKRAGIMETYFCTLYRLKPDHHDLRQCTMYKFCTGRVGNTSMRNFDLPDTN